MEMKEFEEIKNQLISDLRNRGIHFEIKYHDGSKDSGYYTSDVKGNDSKGIYTIDIPNEATYNYDINSFDEKDIFEYIYSMFHEYKHILQRENSIYEPIDTLENQDFAKAAIIAEHFMSYDSANYANDPREIDAQIYGLEQAIKYIQINFPWIDTEKCCVEFVKEFARSQK